MALRSSYPWPPPWTRHPDLRDLNVSARPAIRRGPRHAVPADWEGRRPVLLKIVCRAGPDAELNRRITRSATRAGEIRNAHPVFARLFAIRWTEDGLVTLGEYLDGAKRLDQVPRLGVAEVVAIAMRLGGALIHLHENGSAHGDVAARNVLLDATGSARLTDYDFAEPIDGITKTGYRGEPGRTTEPLSDGAALADLITYLLRHKLLHRTTGPNDTIESDRITAIRLLGQIEALTSGHSDDVLFGLLRTIC